MGQTIWGCSCALVDHREIAMAQHDAIITYCTRSRNSLGDGKSVNIAHYLNFSTVCWETNTVPSLLKHVYFILKIRLNFAYDLVNQKNISAAMCTCQQLGIRRNARQM